MRKIIKYTLSGISIIFILGLLVLLIWGGDAAPVKDSELLPSKVRIAKEDNLIYDFKPWMNKTERELVFLDEDEISGEFRKVYWPEELDDSIPDLLKNKEWNEQLVSKVLEQNSKSLSEFNAIMEGSNLTLQIPKLEDPQNSELLSAFPSFRNLRRLMKINMLSSYSLLRNGKQKQAIDRTIKTVEAVYAFQNAENQTLIQALIGVRVEEQALEALKRIASKTTLSSREAKQYISKLDKINNHQENLKRALKCEYLVTKNRKEYFDRYISGEKLDPSTEVYKELDQFFRDPIGNAIKFLSKFGYFYKPNKTEQTIASYFRPHIASTDKFYKDMEKWEFPHDDYINRPFSLSFKELMRKNYIGKSYLSISLMPLQGTFMEGYKLNYKVKSSQLLLALKAYKRQHGVLPNKLEELVPVYFKEVPLDPFDGKQIRYSKEKKILYSVGKDLQDNNGDPEKDLVTEIEF